MNFDAEIAEKRQIKQKVLDEMEIKKEILLEELIKFTSNWFEKETLSTIKANAEKVIELGEDKARRLKGKIKELKERSPELVQKYMGEDYLWWHTNEDKVSYYSGNHKLLSNHEKKIKSMFGELGKILIEYGLVKASSEHARDISYAGNWFSEGYNDNTKLKYGYGLNYSEELYNITNEYIDLIKQAQDINDQIEKIEEKKKREDVEDWWESL